MKTSMNIHTDRGNSTLSKSYIGFIYYIYYINLKNNLLKDTM